MTPLASAFPFYSLGFWKHEARKIIFRLCVDDFGVKYFTDEDKQHLLNALRNHYKIRSMMKVYITVD